MKMSALVSVLKDDIARLERSGASSDTVAQLKLAFAVLSGFPDLVEDGVLEIDMTPEDVLCQWLGEHVRGKV